MAILTIAFIFMFVKQTYNYFLLTALSLSLFLTYQTRPSFLFLIPLVPLLTFVLVFFFNYHHRVRNNGSSLLGMVRFGRINRLNSYLARDLID